MGLQWKATSAPLRRLRPFDAKSSPASFSKNTCTAAHWNDYPQEILISALLVSVDSLTLEQTGLNTPWVHWKVKVVDCFRDIAVEHRVLWPFG